MLIGVFHRFKSKGCGEVVCSVSLERASSLLPGNEDAIERHSPSDIIQELLFELGFTGPIYSSYTNQPTYKMVDEVPSLCFWFGTSCHSWRLPSSVSLRQCSLRLEMDGKEKMKKTVVHPCTESFLHIFSFQELHVYQCEVLQTLFIFKKR